MTLKYIMASHKAKNKPLHVAYLDISKAYDTVNHEQMWNICEQYGIQEQWLDNLKSMYQGATLTALTRYGKTEEVEMKRGIRQGCPLSPVLFALYVQPIAEALQQKSIEQGTYKHGKPNMLFYADDMVLWGQTKKELQEKLQTVVGLMEQLGLQISTTKTEIQANEFVKEATDSIAIHTEQGEKSFKYVPGNQAIRYLGSWSTLDLQDKEGVEKLQAKVKQRLKRISNLRATPHTKMMLLKARVLSVINYTAATQTLPGAIMDEWEKEIYRIMTKGHGKLRRDLVYEVDTKGGMNMTHVKEEYKVNRLRGLTQMVEGQSRQEGRGQIPWIQKKVLKDLGRAEPYLPVVGEMQEILTKGMNMEIEPDRGTQPTDNNRKRCRKVDI